MRYTMAGLVAEEEIGEDDIVTAKQCKECKGEGQTVEWKANIHRLLTCRYCRGTGRVPLVSGEFQASR